MQIIFLGTGAAVPTVNRWASSIALSYANEILLFDCGEGAQVQFLKARLKPGKLSRVFISHFHGDHLYGLIGFLTTLQLNGRDKELSLYGPKGLKGYLAYMEKLSQFTFRFKINIFEISPEEEDVAWDCGDYTIFAKPLQHRTTTYGYRFEEKPKPGKFDSEKAAQLGIPDGPERTKLMQGEKIVLANGAKISPNEVIGASRNGKKVAICTDTMPCENAISLAQGADLLIHEGTFEAARSELARETRHSTVTQAADVAKKANAKRLFLTHISARYDNKQVVALEAEARAVFQESVVAKDLMKIDL